MADLTTLYMGLSLRNPVIAGSSGLMKSLDNLRAAEDAGAGAVVLKSIFEEQILMEIKQGLNASDLGMHPEAFDYMNRLTREHSVDAHLSLIQSARAALQIPVIASIHCVSSGEWIEYSQRMENAGANALELNVLISDLGSNDASTIEARYFELIDSVHQVINIPVALKIGMQFTNLPKIIMSLSQRAEGLVLFNRYWSPDIDLEQRTIVPAPPFSQPSEISGPLRWIAMMSDQVDCDLCGSTGVHDARSALKLIAAGAKTVQVCSVLYLKGVSFIAELTRDMNAWLEQHQYSHVSEIRSTMGAVSPKEMAVWGRTQFMKYYSELE
jgi:dihydroorotate dehydrogenase (fumarate)